MRSREAQKQTYVSYGSGSAALLNSLRTLFFFLLLLSGVLMHEVYLLCGQVGSVLVLRDPAVLVTLKMEYVNITLNNILSIYRSEH
jgi:hypothetical protein